MPWESNPYLEILKRGGSFEAPPNGPLVQAPPPSPPRPIRDFLRRIWSDIKADCRFCSDAIKAGIAEGWWRKIVTSLGRLHKTINLLLGTGLLAIMLVLYFKYVYPVVGKRWTAIFVLSIIVLGFLIIIRFVRKHYEKMANSLIGRRDELLVAKNTIETLRQELSADRLELVQGRAEIAESKKYKLIFEVDARHTRVRIEQTKSALRIWLDLQLRFENRDIHPLVVKGLSIGFHRRGIQDQIATRDVLVLFGIVGVNCGGIPMTKEILENLSVAGREVTPFYMIKIFLAIEADEEIRTAEDIKANDCLRLTMKSSGYQPDFTVDIHPSWHGAMKDEGSDLIFVSGPSIDRDWYRLD
jgi:hypothetical protein